VPREVPQKNVVDSSGWIEYFADGPNSGFFEAAILDAGSLVVLSISIYELFKRLLRNCPKRVRNGVGAPLQLPSSSENEAFSTCFAGS
jgi:hypothetical protein